MVDLTVRNVSQDVVNALKRRAAANGRSPEAEHRELLRATLLGSNADFAARAQALRRRFDQNVDVSVDIDPGLVGGAIVRAGDTVIDGSVRGRLTRLVESLRRN